MKLLPFLLCTLTTIAFAADPQPSQRIVSLGDSITKGVRPGVTDKETFSYYLQQELNSPTSPVEVRNVGIGGERTDQALKRLDKDVLALKPRIVLIMYGHNDSYVDAGAKQPRISPAEYADNLRQLVERLRKADAQPILMTPPAYSTGNKNGIGDDPDILLEQYARTVRDVADELKVPLVDHYALWRKRRDDGEEIRNLTTDGYHPNPTGHKLLSETILPTLRKTLLPETVSSLSQGTPSP